MVNKQLVLSTVIGLIQIAFAIQTDYNHDVESFPSKGKPYDELSPGSNSESGNDSVQYCTNYRCASEHE